jgi:hypothetical protein
MMADFATTIAVAFRIGVLLSQISGKGTRVQLGARIFHDLGVYGDDAHELIQMLEAEFALDTTEFEFVKYFPPEFDSRWSRLLFWHSPSRLHKERFTPLTVHELIEACVLGKLTPKGPTSL